MPSPADYASESEFMSACVSTRQGENPDEGNDQSVAVCTSMWHEHEAGTEHEHEKKAKPVIHKTRETLAVENMEFVLSDATIDRYGDSVDSAGWLLDNFKKNPIALFNHNQDFPIGRWRNLGVRNGALRGHLEFAPKGTSARIDEIRALVDAGILCATSVGFMPISVAPRTNKSGNGNLYSKQELVETSLVAVPANPNALAVAKSLKVSGSTMELVFAKQGVQGPVTKSGGSNGKQAENGTTHKRTMTMVPISKRIEETEQRIVKFQDELDTHMATVDDSNPTEEALTITKELTERIEKQQASLDSLKSVEARLATTAARANGEVKANGNGTGTGTAMVVHNARPFAYPAKKISPLDHLWRGVVVALKHHDEKSQRPILDVLRSTYGENEYSEQTRAVMANLVTKAAAIPADTVTTGWAIELVQTVIGDFINALMPLSVYPKLAAKGGSFTFGRNGTISLPARNQTATIGGAFFQQGAAIPVKQGAFTAITLTPKKMGVITTLTREITEHSTPSIEGIVRQAILEDTALAIDTVLLDANAATVIRPAGIKNGATVVTPTAGGAVAALIGDLRGLTSSLITASKGNLRAPVWIMNPGDALAAQLTQAAAGGDFPFMDDISNGTLMGYPVITSTTVAADSMILMDAADFISATGDTPRFDVSDQAVLHMEDTNPSQISTVGTPATVAAPVRSLWQTDTIGIRMIMDINWAMRRTGMVHTITTMTWN